MTDDPTSDPGPVAEYRDPELARRFDGAPIPAHGPDFWSDLEASLSGASTVGDGPHLTAVPADSAASPIPPASPIAEAGPVPDASPLPDPVPAGRWGTGRWLAVAAAVLVVAGAGGLAIAYGQGRSSPIVSAAPASSASSSTTMELEADEPVPPSTTAAPTSTSTTSATVISPPPSAGDAVDYFDGGATVVPVGTGRAVGFSPDDRALLVVDEGPGPGLGCEGAHLLALYAQDLATGARIPALPDGMAVETGGLQLAISPFGATPPEVGARPVYWTDWCDGVRATTRRGLLAPDGTISMIEDVEAGGDQDPFADGRTDLGEGASAVGRPSPDGTAILIVEERSVRVSPIDDPSAGPTLPDAEPAGGTVYRTGAWAPTGEVVAVASGTEVVLWNPTTGEQQRFDAAGVLDLVFDNSGRRLAVVSAGETGYATKVFTFGGLPDPTPAPARCSGGVELAPIETRSLTSAGLSSEAAATAAAVDRAAATCDWAALARLTGKEFTASFGGADAVGLWEAQEAAGDSPMWALRQLLRLPAGTRAGDDDTPAMFVWPALQLREDCDYRKDRRTLDALGYDLEQAEEDCEQVGGYLGYRTAIDADGRWRYFVAGD